MVNYLAVLVASVAGFLVGWIWYGPLFGSLWMRLVDMKKTDMKPAAGPMIMGFITTLVTAGVLAWLLQLTGMQTLTGSIGLAALIWLGFFATTSLGGVLWEKKPLALWFLNNAYYLVVLIVIGLILGAWV